MSVFLFLFFIAACAKTHKSVVILRERKLDGCISGDCKNSYGVFIYDNGDKYQGYWKNGLKNGNGTYFYNDESSLDYRKLKKIITNPEYREQLFALNDNKTALQKEKEAKEETCYDTVNFFAGLFGSLAYGSEKTEDGKFQKDYEDKRTNRMLKNMSQKEYYAKHNLVIVYKGFWLNDKMHGEGSLQYKKRIMRCVWNQGKFLQEQ